jgi:hypothetical protein
VSSVAVLTDLQLLLILSTNDAPSERCSSIVALPELQEHGSPQRHTVDVINSVRPIHQEQQ